MIRLTNINKYYNRSKSNEIHVINNTSLTFPEKGLVALTGPSGCGKTTLLNVIGGLDKFNSGSIEFDQHKIQYYSPEKWDSIRNHYIGYIFQNYNLITDKTVYENVEIALNMAGLYNKNEIEERVNYVLRSVGMYNYRKRNVLALSGGQQQRVAIARAIAKNPKVVLADEPTGNLDANNTFEIMGIIKKISQTCLVILVTHEKELVDFYADRVIELKDGLIINDYENEGNKTLDHIDDRNIYLQDLEKESSEEALPIDYYYSAHPGHNPKFQVVYSNNTFYVKVNTKAKVVFLNDESEVRLIDDHYRKPESDDIKESSFDLTQFGEIQVDEKRKSFIRAQDTFLMGFKKVFGHRKFFGKVFLLIYFIISALLVYNLATFGNLTTVREQDFLTVERNLVQVTLTEELTQANLNTILTNTEADELVFYNRIMNFNARISNFYQASGYRSASIWGIMAFPTKQSRIDPNNLIEGDLPDAAHEVALDVWVAETILQSKEASDLGYSEMKDLIGIELSYSYDEYYSVTVTGIVETNSPIIVLADSNYLYLTSKDGYRVHEDVVGEYTITDGVDIASAGEVLIPAGSSYLGVGDTYTLEGIDLEVVGTYTAPEFYDPIIAYEDAKILQTKYLLESWNASTNSTIYLYSDNPELTVSQLTDLGYTAEDAYQSVRSEYITNQNENIAGRLTSIFVTVGGIIVFIFFMMRSSMLGRIKEIGIYRSIGATKKDIYKIFVSEIIAFTTVGSLTGYLLMSYLLNRVREMVSSFASVFYFPWTLFVGGIVGLYLVNLIFGLLPIFSLLRKTPSEINAKYDI